MNKLSVAALLAAGIFAIYSAPSFAAVVTHVPTTPNPPCDIDCGGGDPTEPGEPFTPFFPDPDDEPGDDGDEPGEDPGEPGEDPGKPNEDPGKPGDSAAAAELRKCLARLDDLPQVSSRDIAGLDAPSKVSLAPICEVTSLIDAKPILIEGGNVEGLERAIRGNELIRGKLSQTAYKAKDVVGIDFDADGNAILFVHRRG